MQGEQTAGLGTCGGIETHIQQQTAPCLLRLTLPLWCGRVRGRIESLPLARVAATVAIVLAVSALVVTTYIAYDVLEAMPHVQDDVAYLFQARTFALGRVYVPSPPLPRFFESEFIINADGKWFSKYPPGWPLLLSLGVRAGVPWLVNPILAALSLGLIYLIGREVYGRRIALLATLLGLSSPFFLFMSGSMMAHPATLFYLWLFALCFIYSHRVARLTSCLVFALGAGFFFGMAFITRQLTALGVALPFGVWALATIVRQRQRALARYALMALGAAIPLAFFLWYNAVLTGNSFETPFSLERPWDRLGFGPGIGVLLNYTPNDALRNAGYNFSELTLHLFGWPPFLTLVFAAIPFLRRTRRGADYLFLGSFVGLVGAYLFYWADGVMYGPRYYYEALPALLLLTARGVQETYRWLGACLGRNRARRDGDVPPSDAQPTRSGHRIAALVVTALLIGLLGYNLRVYLPSQFQAHRGYNYMSREPLKAVAAANLHHALVFVQVEPEWQWWQYGALFIANSPLLEDDVIFVRHLGVRDQELMARFPGWRYYLMRGLELREITDARF